MGERLNRGSGQESNELYDDVRETEAVDPTTGNRPVRTPECAPLAVEPQHHLTWPSDEQSVAAPDFREDVGVADPGVINPQPQAPEPRAFWIDGVYDAF